MITMMIQNYDDFIRELWQVGFSGAVGGRDDGVFALFRYGWGAEEETGIVWHTGDPDTDPWEWRMRVLEERNDIAYGKLFFNKAGYITKEWYPYFLAARRGNSTFEEEYEDGRFSRFAKRIYDTVVRHESLALQDIKRLGGFKREDKSKFDSALTELQMGMFLTMSGRQQKRNYKGEISGWSSTMFCTVESFFGEDVFDEAAEISAEKATSKIAERIYSLNPQASQKKIERFIRG